MSRIDTLEPEFVEEIPRDLVDGKLYISIEYATALHLCCCGCGSEVVTPIHGTRWTLIYDGAVSLHPSVGSWSLPCSSHYVIMRNRVRWEPHWSYEEIQAGREHERFAAERYFSSRDYEVEASASEARGPTGPLGRILRRLRS